jgi:hypothetical protein
MLSFSPKENFRELVNRLRDIDPSLAEDVEEEYVFPYPHVVSRLEKAGIRPHTAYEAGKVPEELV